MSRKEKQQDLCIWIGKKSDWLWARLILILDSCFFATITTYLHGEILLLASLSPFLVLLVLSTFLPAWSQSFTAYHVLNKKHTGFIQPTKRSTPPGNSPSIQYAKQGESKYKQSESAMQSTLRWQWLFVFHLFCSNFYFYLFQRQTAGAGRQAGRDEGTTREENDQDRRKSDWKIYLGSIKKKKFAYVTFFPTFSSSPFLRWVFSFVWWCANMKSLLK